MLTENWYVMPLRFAGVPLSALLVLGTHAPVALAQAFDPGLAAPRTLREDGARVAELLGRHEGLLFDSSSNVVGWKVAPVRPTIQTVWNSALPTAAQGPLWAGRGLNVSVTAGARLQQRWSGKMFTLTFAPTVTYSQNRPFQFVRGIEAGRSAFSSPWHTGIASADLPLRFGDRSLRAIHAGESGISLSAGALVLGAETGSEWWGPAIRNTLVLSDNAGGIPRLSLRTARPLATSIGLFSGRAIIGTLTESAFFDGDETNDHRSVSGLLLTFRPAIDTLLTLGVSRLVIAPLGSRMPLAHALDVVTRWEPIASPTALASGTHQDTDQLFSLFARWRFPASGLETYAEWARMELPRSLREVLLEPQSTSGYTIGAQFASPRPGGGVLRAQTELTYLEQTQVYPDRPPLDFYTGRATAHGFTQRGQLLGADAGPGSSAQFGALDWLGRGWQLGIMLGRTRRENDALYRQADARLTRHDVEVYGGVRGGRRLSWSEVTGSIVIGHRMNYLLQSDFNLSEPVIANDVRNVTLSLLFAP